VAVAASKAYDVAQNTILRHELETARQQLEVAEERVVQLQQELDTLQVKKVSADTRVHTLELELSQARGEVAELRARLSAYAITGGDKPIPVALIILVSALAVAILVIVLLIVVRLVL
jgi:outer membrane protein TolC